MLKKTLLIFVSIPILLYLGFGLLLYFNQSDFIYYPNDQNFDSCKNFDETEKLSLNGTRAYFKRNSDRIVVFYHGNAGSACDRVFIKNIFEKANYSFLLVEYTGYSGDLNKPGKEAIFKDVENVRDFLKNEKFSETVLMSESIGCAFASYHASISEFDRLLLISPFNKMTELAGEKFSFFPVSLILKDKYNNEDLLADKKNITIIHGDKDNVIPIYHSKKLFSAIKSNEKEFISIEGAGHNDMYNSSKVIKIIKDYFSFE